MTGKHQMKGTRVGRECRNNLDTPTVGSRLRYFKTADRYHTLTQGLLELTNPDTDCRLQNPFQSQR